MVTFKGQFIKGIIEVNTLQAFHKGKKDPYHCKYQGCVVLEMSTDPQLAKAHTSTLAGLPTSDETSNMVEDILILKL